MAHDRKRCAVYTRKSSEEGLDQDFNSLDAQREACAAYISSQRHEGWELVDQIYDDGGYSGGTLERPALKRLMQDVEVGLVDIIVVYKVDRLTRALADFAKIVEMLDGQDASFVSVTQQFNTTTSTGRLTLNVLLSFAQFEREVTGERIRDKIAASKKKGMWMGGYVPLGFDVADRKLVVNSAEAEIVRQIFDLYLEHRNVRLVEARAAELGLRTKRRINISGEACGGRPLSRGHIYRLLSNPVYVGEISHKGQVYAGEHDPIVDRPTWEKVRAALSENAVARSGGEYAREPSLLTGIVFDDQGRRFTPSHAVKRGQRYRYYVQQRDDGRPQRLSASELESAVTGGLVSVLKDQRRLADLLEKADALPGRYESCFQSGRELADQLASVSHSRIKSVLSDLVERVVVGETELTISVRLTTLMSEPTLTLAVDINIPIEMKRRGIEMKMVLDDRKASGAPDASLVRLVVQARDWWERLLSGEVATAADIARSEGLTRSHVTRVIRLAFLAPDIVQAILDGNAPPDLTAERLLKRTDLPLDWVDQRQLLGCESVVS